MMKTGLLASATVVVTGILWGAYWYPVRVLADLGLNGAWGTAAITLGAALVLLPVIIAQKGDLRTKSLLGVVAIVAGGAAFALYSIGFLYGKVALVVLLWFFSPVWTVLISKFMLRQRVPPLRLLAIVVGLTGLTIMLGGDGGVPLPANLGEWMAFVGGLIWAFSTVGMRLKSDVAPLPAALWFSIGATATALIAAPMLEPLPTLPAATLPTIAAIALVTGGLWWALSIAALMWAALRLDPARLGILLMTEVLFGAISAGLFAGETLAPNEIIGGALVILCGVLEVWPSKAKPTH